MTSLSGSSSGGETNDEEASRLVTNERSARAILWEQTMSGYRSALHRDLVTAHSGSKAAIDVAAACTRLDREHMEMSLLAPAATHALGAGNRVVEEAPDAYRTCFERDRDRIVHSTAFRRLAGKTQVFVFPDDHQRTRLTHALEVAQVARAIARALSLNVDLCEAIALGHDCGHGPGGHPSEDVFARYLDGGFDHATWGADVVLQRLNLCAETADAIRNHSWSRPSPSTAEGEVVAWADRIAYVCHDFEDARTSGIVDVRDLPAHVVQCCGTSHSGQIAAFISGVVEATCRTGRIGMTSELASALATFRQCNYDLIYLRSESLEQARRVSVLLEALVECFANDPHLLPLANRGDFPANSGDAFRASVTYVAGMTDRFALRSAKRLLDWPIDEMPMSVGDASRDETYRDLTGAGLWP